MKFKCEACNYESKDKSNFNKHLKTQKHIKTQQNYDLSKKNVNSNENCKVLIQNSNIEVIESYDSTLF